MVLNPNQFNMTPVQGEMDLQFHGSVFSMAVDATQASALVAGQAVKLYDRAVPLPTVVALAANTDATFGFVVRNLKDATFPALSRVEIATNYSVMYMTAGAAIARGAKVEVVYTTNKVITNAGTNPVAGLALDKATADGDLIRIMVLNPAVLGQTISDIAGLAAALEDRVQVATVTATLAEINAGKTLIAGVSGKAITVTNITQRVTGNFTTTTSVDVQSSNVSPVKVAVAAQAQLTNGAVLVNNDTGVTLDAGWAVPLGTGDGLVVTKVGSNAAGGTSIKYTINYIQT